MRLKKQKENIMEVAPSDYYCVNEQCPYNDEVTVYVCQSGFLLAGATVDTFVILAQF